MLLRMAEVAQLLDVKPSRAYSIIKQLNNELTAQGYMTLSGRIERSYLLERFGLKEEDKSND